MTKFHQEIPNSVKTAFLTVLFIFVFLYIFSSLFGPIPFAVNSVTTNKTDMFTVSGEGEASAVPDTALIHLGVTKTSSNIDQAKNEVNEAVNAINDEIKKLGVEGKNVKTTNFYINPNYDYNNGRQTITGYTVTQDLEIRIKPIDKANQAVDRATAVGANTVGGISFVLDDENKDKLEQQAREQAIKKAKAKAESIASAAGIKLGKLINVSETPVSQPLPMSELRAVGKGGAGGSASTDLQPGENVIHTSIILTYETY